MPPSTKRVLFILGTLRETRTRGATIPETSSARIADLLRADIADGTLAPGEHIRIGELAARYGTSHLPVREALRILEGDRLVHSIPHKGSTVRLIDRKFVENIYDVRTELETYLMRRTVPRITEAELDEVVRLRDEFADAVRRGDIGGMVRGNRALHDAINRPADNAEAQRILRNGWELVAALRSRFGYSVERLEEISEEHEAIVQAMRKRNIEVASLLIRQHADAAKHDLLRKMQEASADAPAAAAG